MSQARRPKWDYFSENVPGNAHAAAIYVRTYHPEWDVVAVEFNGGNYTVVVYRIPWDESRYQQEEIRKQDPIPIPEYWCRAKGPGVARCQKPAGHDGYHVGDGLEWL